MIRLSNHLRADLLQALGAAVPRFQQASEAVERAASDLLGLNRTDLRLMGVLARMQPQYPSALASGAGLSRAAMTTALDRLERAGYALRVPDRSDRRRVMVELTPLARDWIARIWEPLADDGASGLEAFGDGDLALILRFLADGEALQQAHARRIRRLGNRPE